jgi:hypothetical protein
MIFNRGDIMLNKGIILIIFYSFIASQVACQEEKVNSSSSSSSSSSGCNFPFTPEELEKKRNSQIAAIVENEMKVVNVGTNDAMRSHIYQMFLYGSSKHKQVDFSTFHHKHTYEIENFIEAAEIVSCLDKKPSDAIYHKIMSTEPAQRDLDSNRNIKVSENNGKFTIYRIVGLLPFSDGFRDQLFDVSKAKSLVRTSTEKYIDENYDSFVQSSLRKRKHGEKKVLKTPCCQEYIHKRCVASCQENQIKSCPNLRCKVAENGTSYSKHWDSKTYDEILGSQEVERKQLSLGQLCFVCSDSLHKSLDGVLSNPPTNHRKKQRGNN